MAHFLCHSAASVPVLDRYPSVLTMASCKVDKQNIDTKDTVTVSDLLLRCSHDDITEELYSNPLDSTVKAQKSEKFKRTALTFFGVRKSFCLLPNFFGGRNKNQSKGSKKGITKCKTYDGLSKIGHDDGLCQSMSAEDTESHSQKNSFGQVQQICNCECSHPNADQKSLTLGRQKKGLRGFFHSFRHHRNHRNFGTDKTKVIAVSPPHSCYKELPSMSYECNENVAVCLAPKPHVPDFEDVKCNVAQAECRDAETVALEKNIEQENSRSALDGQTRAASIMPIVSRGNKEMSRGHSQPNLTVQTISEPVLKSEVPSESADQLNLIFGEVSSLKSFDSLTGCGDIIADQEDDTVPESTVAGERSRNGGKRASCYLTYQGGGEEMALPEDLDCLPNMWENDAIEEMCCSCSEDHLNATVELKCSHGLMKSVQQSSGMDKSLIADMLTPQSEHQESAPNSDEGYYDSTTPGPDEVQEKPEGLRTDTLPRDSYSGDALYELFAPDESLVSPQYENKTNLPGLQPLVFSSKPPNATDPEMKHIQIGGELYGVHKFLDGTKSPKLVPNVVSRQEIGFNTNCNIHSSSQKPCNINSEGLCMFDEKESFLDSVEKRTGSYNVNYGRHANLAFVNPECGPDFETFYQTKKQHNEEDKPHSSRYSSVSSHSSDCNNDLDDGQTVSFSQALVDYTKHSQMLSNLQNNVDDLETNTDFSPTVEALPPIVTFDVVDMHNEGEYDKHIHMELEEDISSPYQELEESYLQKDQFAEFDYEALDLYEQNLISNAWAAASLPRHLGLTRGSQVSLDRRSRSLDRERLDLNMPATCKNKSNAIVFSSNSQRDSLSHQGDSHVFGSDNKDCNNIKALSLKAMSEKALSHHLTEEGSAQNLQPVSHPHIKHNTYSNLSTSDFDGKLHYLCSNALDLLPCDDVSKSREISNRQLALSNCSLPHGNFVYREIVADGPADIDDNLYSPVTNFQT
ncbi:APC membrane recruitment protein 1-like isoform X2 [Cynoglossus semilaevis]|uniref:APC membrane recruitment protein 1 n=2 Tax=Cynoglossus semilaevis TaxID=244447 RepID=A0A3P8W1P2_CYNSE|nr:APC membrane recruitment protein 1-like isoform X2 [Cynoglossus semilaevis]